MSDITITTEGTSIYLASPYNPDTSPKAKALGGSWDAARKAWRFDARDEDRVRALAVDIFGTDGAPAQTVTVRLAMDEVDGMLVRQRGPEHVHLFGRAVVTRRGRDMPVTLGKGVVCVEGGFAASGGSVKNPAINAQPGTILEIRDVPAGHKDLAEYGQVVDEQVDVDALLAERDKLMARLAEIDALLPEPEGTTVTTREAAAALGVSVRTVQRWAASGKVAAEKDNVGRWVITITIGEQQ